MTRASSTILDSGQPFPPVQLDTVAHGRVDLPETFGNGWGVFLVYRAHW